MKHKSESVSPAVKFTSGGAPLTTPSGSKSTVPVLFSIDIVLSPSIFGSPRVLVNYGC